MRPMGQCMNAVWCAAALALAAGIAPAQTNAPPAAPTFWFPVGEELVYRIYWGASRSAPPASRRKWWRQPAGSLLAIRMRNDVQPRAGQDLPRQRT